MVVTAPTSTNSFVLYTARYKFYLLTYLLTYLRCDFSAWPTKLNRKTAGDEQKIHIKKNVQASSAMQKNHNVRK